VEAAVRILLDVDGVLADFPSTALRYINERAGREYLLGDIEEHDILKALCLTHWQDDFDRWCSETDVCRELEPYDGARAFVDALREIGEVVCVTSPYGAVPTWQHSRLAWLKEHVGIEKRDVVFCKRKELVRGNLLIDDKIENVEAFGADGGGMGLLFTRPWNVWHSGGYHMRVSGYQHALRVAKIWKRACGETHERAVKEQA
jgi:5'(3')-deoxyribonucleotidase